MKKFRLPRRGARFLPALAVLAAAPGLAMAEQIVAFTADGRVITFDSATPGTLTGNRVLSGIVGNVVAADVRPAGGELYCVTDAARVYRVDVATGVATSVGTGPFTSPLGALVGMTFDPAADRFRIVNDLDRNLRVDPSTATLVDGDPVTPGVQPDAQLQYAAADVNFGTDPTVVALATDADAKVYGIDATLDTLVTLHPADAGTLQTVGPLGVFAGGQGGLDVSSTTGVAFAALTLQGQGVSGLYLVSLASGGVALIGNVAYPSTVVAMAVGPTTAIPPLPSRSLVGLTSGGELIRFESDAPATITSRTTITGLVSGDTLVALDTRPSLGRLYGLGSGGRIYVVNGATGLATPVRAAPFETPLVGTTFGFDFNPDASRIRIVSDQGQNLRVDPDTGAVIDGDTVTAGVQTDAPLAYAPGDANQGVTPHVTAAAYDANLTTTNPPTLFAIDTDLGVLVRVGALGGTPQSANSGVLHTVGSLGVGTFARMSGFEIVGDSTAFATLVGGGPARLYFIDLNTGLATLVDGVGAGEGVVGLATAPTSDPPAPGGDLLITRLAIRMDYARTGRDSIAVDGSVPFPTGALEGQVVLVDVGGFSKAFTLGRVGKARLDETTRTRFDDDNFAFAARPRDGRLKFTVRIRREDVSDELTDEGMGETETARRAPRIVQATITVSGTSYTLSAPLRFTAKAGKSAAAEKN